MAVDPAAAVTDTTARLAPARTRLRVFPYHAAIPPLPEVAAMSTATVDVSALPVRAPRAAEPIGRWVAAALRWLSAPTPNDEPRQEVSRLWALANRCGASDPALAADLRAAVHRWDREQTGR